MQFDRHGNRIWRDTRALLDSEHARYAVGAVAVPYGTCTQPANVQAGGGACPVRNPAHPGATAGQPATATR